MSDTWQKYPELKETSKGMVWLALFACIAIFGILVHVYAGAQDSDQWWLLATGREIMENGIPYQNPFSIYDDQAIVIQQWIPAVIDYAVYSALGYVGFGFLAMGMGAVVAALFIYLGYTVMGKRNIDISSIVTIGAVLTCSAYMSIRPQMWSMIAFLLILITLEKYRAKNDWRILVALPVIVLFHANVHLSMMPFDFFIVVIYALPKINFPHFKTSRSTYDKRFLLIVLPVMAVASIVNPYGIDGALYLLNSYGAASYGNYIAEMGATGADTYYGMAMVFMMVVGSIALGRNGLRNIDLPLTILFLTTLVLSFQHTRNVWLVAIFAAPLFCSACRDVVLMPRLVFLRDNGIKYIGCLIGIFAMCVLGVQFTTGELVKEPEDSATTPMVAMDYLDSHASRDARIFTHFNAGGYVEWRGYKASMDARPELWNSAVSKSGVDRYTEYIDLSKNKKKPAEYMAGKEFDYMVVNTDTELYKYLLADATYKVVSEGDNYTLFENSKTASV